MSDTGSAFAEPPAPKITSANKSGTRVLVEGEGFIDLAKCKLPLKFQIGPDQDGAAKQPVTGLTIESDTKASFDLPAQAGGAKQRVSVLLGDAEKSSHSVQ